jgi:predicted nucleic acid-binding protein
MGVLKQGDKHMKIYMDVCCLGRPFDDLTQARIYLEAEAILSIISRCESGDWTLISSGTIDFEISQIPDFEVQDKINSLYSTAREHHKITQKLVDRAKEFQNSKIGYFDSLHMAIAESANVDVMLTTDDRLVKRSQNSRARIKIANPVTWLMEVTEDE